MEKQQYEELKRVQDKYWWFRAKREILIAAIDDAIQNNKLSVGKAMDIGCGMGLMLESLSQRFQLVYGIDMEQEAVDYCHGRFPGCFVQTGILPDHIPSMEPVDCIVASDVLEHIENDEAALKKLFDMLRSKGILFITVPAHPELWSYNDELNHHFRRYEYQELKSKLLKAGFAIESLSYYNSRLYPPVLLTRKLKNNLRIKTSDVGVRFHDGIINRVLYRIFVSEKSRLKGSGFKNGVSLICAARKPEVPK